MKGLIAPTLQQLEAYNVNVDGQPEVIWQPIYDYQAYPAAGFTGRLDFFQVPAGQGGKTFEDTNMETAALLPVPVNMAITAVEVVFRPANVVSATGAIVGLNWNDVNAVQGSRMSLEIVIGSKTYLIEAPLGALPNQFRVAGAAALSDTTTAAAARVTKIDYAVMAGPLYQIVPLRLISQQNFRVSINSPAAVALPSTVAGRIGIRLHGFRYRLAQ